MKNEANVRILTALIFAVLLFSAAALSSSCRRGQITMTNQPGGSPPASATSAPTPQVSPVPVRTFQGSGIVTKIVRENPYDKSLASVEVNHGEIVGLMPAMRMEFYVKHVSLLDGLKEGDVIDFTIEEKGGTEIISAIKKK